MQRQPQRRDERSAGGLLREELPWQARASANQETGEVLPFPPRPGHPAAARTHARKLLPQDYEAIQVSAFRVAVRLVQLVAAILYFFVTAAIDWLTFLRWPSRAQTSLESREAYLLERRAVRLRRIFQRLGGTFIKVGQQVSIRTDVFHPIYCQELQNLQDDAETIPDAYVREVVERQTGRPVEVAFARFDFSAYGKASIACVYKAELPGGKVVAVKIRRPDIDRHFKTDLTALSWVLRSAEFLTILRPRISESFRNELQAMLTEELDFHLEVRYQELFRRYFKKRKKLRTTAPKLYFHLCGPDMIVSEFVTGIWMNDLMLGVESGGPRFLDELRKQDIDPERIAKQLVRGSHYGFFECPFFHGDPHPGNILVKPGNRIVLVDFGACGVFAERERHQLAQMHYYHSQENVGGMVQCVINLMEPLPPIDVEELRRRLENEWWKGFYGIKSKHAGWQERTSFRLWTALFREVQRFKIPLPLNVLRMIRATLLYDSVAARIYPGINVFREYRKYYHDYAKRVQRNMQCSFLRQLWYGPDPEHYVTAKRVWDVSNVALRWAQIFLQKPVPDFVALVSKGYEMFMIFVKWIFLSGAITAGAVAAGIGLKIDEIKRADPSATLWYYPGKLTNELIQDIRTPGMTPFEGLFLVWIGLTAIVTFKYGRQMWFRLRDKDAGVDRGSNGPFGSRR